MFKMKKVKPVNAFLPSMLFGSESMVRVLLRRPSPEPSIQM